MRPPEIRFVGKEKFSGFTFIRYCHSDFEKFSTLINNSGNGFSFAFTRTCFSVASSSEPPAHESEKLLYAFRLFAGALYGDLISPGT